MRSCLFVADLHGDIDKHRALFDRMLHEHPTAVFLGGDLLPSGIGRMFSEGDSREDFVSDFLAAELASIRSKLGDAYPGVFLIFGNDDARSEEPAMLAVAEDGIWHYAHMNRIDFDSYSVYGYANIPPSPFQLKDWEKFDVSRYVDPGCVSPLAGMRTVPVSEREIKFGTIADYDPRTFDPDGDITRIGGGSLGGKGRGLAFLEVLVNMSGMQDEFQGVNISIPTTIILETDLFDRFMDENDLGEFALGATDDRAIVRRFLKAELPSALKDRLREILKVINYPLAVRSSSLLEDSQFQPFAGVYETCMVPNNNKSPDVRLEELMSAIKRVYASTFFNKAKRYIKATPYRLEEEKMAVMIQKLVGHRFRHRFYPDISGVARSHNFYPVKPMKSEDGIASVALGLGAIVVEGGLTIKFCPKYPRHQVQFSSADDMIKYSQREFYALKIPARNSTVDLTHPTQLLRLGLGVAEKDNTLGAVGSTYSQDNDAISDGLSRSGLRLVSFASILKHDVFPLAAILDRVLAIGRAGMSAPVEIEFSVRLPKSADQSPEFHLLQLRPMSISHEPEQIEVDDIPDDCLICRSAQVLGNGLIDDVHDIVLVDIEKFDRSKMVMIAKEVAKFNIELTEENRPYLLVGIGRWGSADSWLGIPVSWDEIFGARTIIETGFKDIKVTPSQGTHFFQNINAFHVGYFTVSENTRRQFVNWDWLIAQPPAKKRTYTRLLRFDNPVEIRMNGRAGAGAILKPLPTGG